MGSNEWKGDSQRKVFASIGGQPMPWAEVSLTILREQGFAQSKGDQPAAVAWDERKRGTAQVVG
jgi:hypothetical protein